MLVTISNALHRLAKGWIILVFFILDAGFMGLILPMVQGEPPAECAPSKEPLLAILPPAAMGILVLALGLSTINAHRALSTRTGLSEALRKQSTAAPNLMVPPPAATK